ncbi:MAG: small membrane hydrophobic protein, partial [Nocardia sp.]|nr:small membrane hydrophobic protein [Nocardia sp.]
PLGDMTTVLSYDGSTAAAFGIHGLTAALVALAGALLIREPRDPAPARA